jgi:hypothetical protein
MHQVVQALPTPQTPTVHWTDVSKPVGTSLENSISAMGPLHEFDLVSMIGILSCAHTKDV